MCTRYEYKAYYSSTTENSVSLNFSYALDGSMTYRPVDAASGWTQVWNGENRMVETYKGTNRLPFKYDTMGRRVEKCVYSNNTLTSRTLYVYDGFKCVEELDALSNNSIVMRHTWQPFDVGLDVILATKDASGTSYFLHDANKNVMQKTNINGALLEAYVYAPFGENVGNDNAHIGVSSEIIDYNIGLIYYNYRYYSFTAGRWIKKDMIEEFGGINTYCFVKNVIINYCDFLGLKDEIIKPDKQCEKNGKPLSLSFDGINLFGDGISMPAVSGKPVNIVTSISYEEISFLLLKEIVKKNYTFSYTKERQKKHNIGPIPEGQYWLAVNEKRCKSTSKYSHIIKKSAWGDYSWSLHIDNDTETYQRDGFFIHGGNSWGSAGCIDIKNGDKDLNVFLSGLCDCFIPVNVHYSIDQNISIDENIIKYINLLNLNLMGLRHF